MSAQEDMSIPMAFEHQVRTVGSQRGSPGSQRISVGRMLTSSAENEVPFADEVLPFAGEGAATWACRACGERGAFER